MATHPRRPPPRVLALNESTRPGSPKRRADVWIGVYLGAVDAPSSNPSAVIDVVGLVKSFGRTKALNELNLSVAQGRSTDSWDPTH